MKKYLIIVCYVAAILSLTGCAAGRNATTLSQGDGFEAEEIELYGFGVGRSSDENTARGIAMTNALGDLSVKMQASVRTASSEYKKQTGISNKALYESLIEVVSDNRLEGVVYSGDRRPSSFKNGQYEYRVEARVNHTLLKKKVDSILDELDATDEEREAFRSYMHLD